jgi:hypothetical protein
VTQVQNVKATIGHDQLFALGPHGGAPVCQLAPGNDFIAEMHNAIFVDPPSLGNAHYAQRSYG